jgi:hypothetical protein
MCQSVHEKLLYDRNVYTREDFIRYTVDATTRISSSRYIFCCETGKNVFRS